MGLEEAFQVLKEMMGSFEAWFPIEELVDEEDVEMYKERFAATKLNLEIGEYSREDYRYLFLVREMLAENTAYYNAIDTFIRALSREYGWI